ncbi:hypothetical protein BOX15_Mlig016424g1 [Macrostomum lignano]|uniref:Cadherin domain-containing protein n=1 Tax=Macrostomum lignano TaxID=282301 RepID=A0A267GWV5_9PLAT|nr:hypothetical protein BOX15_Mlig016424g1 [Macrostomum lignano]
MQLVGLMSAFLAAMAAAVCAVPNDCSRISADLTEGSPPDTPVVNLGDKLGLAVGQAEFALLNDRTDGHLLSLNSKSGLVSTRMSIYRDTLISSPGHHRGSCDRSGCVVPIMVQVSYGDSIRLCTVRLRLEERNNHAPEFKVTSPIVEVSELAELDTRVGLRLVVTDRDSPRYGVARLQLTPFDPKDTGLFDVAPLEPNEKDHRVVLLLRGKLDRETKTEHHMLLTAFDGGSPPKSASLNLTVRVRDENDHAPVWVTKNFRFNLTENAEGGQLIVKLEATDEDAGPNGRIIYLFNDPRPSREAQMFYLHPNSGELQVAHGAVLDYERTSVYRIPVVARDRGVVPKQIEQTIIIELQDYNDNVPVISVRGLPVKPGGGPHALSIRENQPPGQTIGYIVARDDDSGNNSHVECNLGSPGEGKIRFRLQQQQRHKPQVVYKLITDDTFDWEATPTVQETVWCHDNGVPRLSASQLITVVILDENDSPPTFDRQVFELAFDEEQQPGIQIHRFEAVDRDQSPTLVYSLDDEGQRIATLGSSTGVLRSAVRFDRESCDQYRFSVHVTDGVHSASAEVRLTIRDVNDHAPEWHPPFTLEIKENSPPSSQVGRVNATDRDADVNGQVKFFVGHNPYFAIRPTGEIFTKSNNLDRERTPSIQLNVTAYDFGQPSRHRSTIVHVTLLDENDNAPVFYFPSPANNRLNVSCDYGPDDVVAKVIANDSDSGENGRLTFNLTGSGQDHFRINPDTGELSLAKSLECGAYQHRFALTIRATDRGSPAQTRIATLLVATTPKRLGAAGTAGSGSANGFGSDGRANSAAGSGRGPDGSGRGGGLGDRDSSLAAIVGLIIATAILIVILVFAICLLRRRNFHQQTDGFGMADRHKRAHLESSVARSASMPPPASSLLEHALIKKSLTQDRNMFSPSPPPYYYTCEPRDGGLGRQQRRRAHQQQQVHAMHQLASPPLRQHHGYQTIRVLNPAIDERADYSRLPAASASAAAAISSMDDDDTLDCQQPASSEVRTQALVSSEPGSGGGGGGANGGSSIKKRSVTLDHRQLKAPYTTVSFV